MTLPTILGRSATVSLVVSTFVIATLLIASVAAGDAFAVPSVISVDTVDNGRSLATDVSLNMVGLIALMAVTFALSAGVLWLAGHLRNAGRSHD